MRGVGPAKHFAG